MKSHWYCRLKARNLSLLRASTVALICTSAIWLTTFVVFAHSANAVLSRGSINPAVASAASTLQSSKTVTDTKTVTGTESMTATSVTATEAVSATGNVTTTSKAAAPTSSKGKKLVRIEVTINTQYSVRLRLRAEPSTTAATLTYLDNRSTWTYIEYSADSKWVRIAVAGFGEDGSGWVARQWVTEKEVFE